MSNKARVMKVLKYLQENTNDEHRVTAEDIKTELAKDNIEVDRKTIYNDIKTLNDMDFSIENNTGGYQYIGELFELPELKIVLDEVRSNAFLSKGKTETIIKKLLSLTNKYDRKMINTGSRILTRASGDSILYSINEIIRAIDAKCAITFKYFDLDLSKNKVFRKNKKDYRVFPYDLIIENNRYYLVCNNVGYENFVTYRLDRMEKVKMDPTARFDKVPTARINDYLLESFSMFSGETESVTLRCDKKLFEEIDSKFEKLNIITAANTGNGDSFDCNVKVHVSPTFFSWVFTFGGKIEILAPAHVKEDFVAMCEKMANLHK